MESKRIQHIFFSQDPIPQAPSHMNSHTSISHISHKPSNLYVQTVPPPIVPSHHGSIAQLIEDKASLKYREDDDGAWDNQIPLTENGLVSMAVSIDLQMLTLKCDDSAAFYKFLSWVCFFS